MGTNQIHGLGSPPEKNLLKRWYKKYIGDWREVAIILLRIASPAIFIALFCLADNFVQAAEKDGLGPLGLALLLTGLGGGFYIIIFYASTEVEDKQYVINALVVPFLIGLPITILAVFGAGVLFFLVIAVVAAAKG